MYNKDIIVEIERDLDYMTCPEDWLDCAPTTAGSTPAVPVSAANVAANPSARETFCKHILDLYLPLGGDGCRAEPGTARPSTIHDGSSGVDLLSAASQIQSKKKGTPPLVVFVHGGGWRRGDKLAWQHFLSMYDTNLMVAFLVWWIGLYENVGLSLAKRGIACAVISYPLSRSRFPWFLLEWLASFLASALFLVPFVTAIRGLSSLWHWQWHGTDPHFGDLLFWVPISSVHLSQIVIAVLMCVTCRQRYGLSRTLSASIFITVIGTTFLLVWTANDAEKMVATSIVLLHTLLVQLVVLLVQLYVPHYVTFPAQLGAVAQSVRWLHSYGRVSGKFDPDRIVLMGHSAGAHLVSMLAVQGFSESQEMTLNTFGIKGIIGISGVYKLSRLLHGLLKHLYVIPAFGTADPDHLTKASPVDTLAASELAPTTTPASNGSAAVPSTDDMCDSQVSKPPFLLINSQWDLHLPRDADDFAACLRKMGVHVEQKRVPRTNHFTVMKEFIGYQAACNREKGSRDVTMLEDVCLKFIRKVTTEHE